MNLFLSLGKKQLSKHEKLSRYLCEILEERGERFWAFVAEINAMQMVLQQVKVPAFGSGTKKAFLAWEKRGNNLFCIGSIFMWLFRWQKADNNGPILCLQRKMIASSGKAS